MTRTNKYIDLSTNDSYPKTLEIRNELGGMIWQIYHVNNEEESIILSNVATINGYEDISLVDYYSTNETFVGWRDTDSWKGMWNEKELYMDYDWIWNRKHENK